MSLTTRAPSPFAASSANGNCPHDLVLRSSDNVDFHVHKTVLFLNTPKSFHTVDDPASQSNASEASDNLHAGLPVARVKEPSAVLRRLLLLCYPQPIPSSAIDVLDHIHLVYRAAHAYNMRRVCDIIRSTLLSRIDADPYRVFAVACSLTLPDTARAAAVGTLKNPNALCSGEYEVSEFSLISGLCLTALCRFRNQCVHASCVAVDRHRYVANCPSDEATAAFGDLCWWSTKGHSRGCGATVAGTGRDCTLKSTGWFKLHMARVYDAVRDTPCSTAAAAAVLDYTACLPCISRCNLCVADAPKQLQVLAGILRTDVDAQVHTVAERWRF
ncbi:hypothetical protein FB45DRAFT_1002582 [Roridomyces roridus]|uniref:BTB domain-containing protein n=1 Tax=Roridomyces roridus TaxID=1738132 RepID=A0AAD7C024_9AGAR|nr:hypothetical protein FB45DRAFT_1002582 [Roridomyces roridus]